MNAPMRWRSVVTRWFVEYNPLYFASALCVLAGVFLAAKELPEDALPSKLGIVAITEAYQVVLILGAWLLLRAGLRRPAAILGLTALFFVLDVAFNGERILSHAGLMSLEPGMRARKAIPASLVLALLGPVKLLGLAWVFRIRGARAALAMAGATIGAIPLLPYAIEVVGPQDVFRQAAHLGVFWLGAPLFGWAFTRGAGSWTTAWTEDVRARRIALAAPFLVAGLFVAHGVAWSTGPGLSMTPAHFSPYFLAATFAWAGRLASRSSRTAEFVAWCGSALSLVTATFVPPALGLQPPAAIALWTGAAMFLLSHRPGLRLLLPAAVCGIGGLYIFASGAKSPLPAPHSLWCLSLAGLLLAGAGRQRDFRCLFGSALSVGAAVVAINPQASLLPFAIILSALWLGGASWILFPELRSWVPFTGAAVVLAVGGAMFWREPPPLAVWYVACAAAAGGLGFALRRVEFQIAGMAAFAVFLAGTRELWVPKSSGGWGLALVAAGFLLLSAGVAFNLTIASRRSQTHRAA